MWCDLVTKKRKLKLLIHQRRVGIYMYFACCLHSTFTGCGHTWSPQLLPPPSPPVFPVAARRPVQGPAVPTAGPQVGGTHAVLPEARWVWAGEAGVGVRQSDLLCHGPAVRPGLWVAGVRPH